MECCREERRKVGSRSTQPPDFGSLITVMGDVVVEESYRRSMSLWRRSEPTTMSVVMPKSATVCWIRS